jgi:V8-like Glu-specific endopeptidase
MKKLMLTATLVLTAQTALAEIKVIYGTDNRQDIYQVSNSMHRTLARSSAGMIKKSLFVKGAKANTFDLREFRTLERAQNICATEKFSQQPVAPICSGFLVSPDTLVTAGHCYNSFSTVTANCNDFAWVFDYDMKSASHNPNKGIPMSNIYTCKKVVSIQRDAAYDFAIIKLDRPVVGRVPLKFRTSGKISDSTPLMVIGHPTGLPSKVAAGGRVTFNSEVSRFSTTLDTFHGNSGSAVFNSSTGLVEGILIMGKNDYQPSLASNPASCKVVNKCSDLGRNCSSGVESGIIQYGEIVLRIEKIASLISKAVSLK